MGESDGNCAAAVFPSRLWRRPSEGETASGTKFIGRGATQQNFTRGIFRCIQLALRLRSQNITRSPSAVNDMCATVSSHSKGWGCSLSRPVASIGSTPWYYNHPVHRRRWKEQHAISLAFAPSVAAHRWVSVGSMSFGWYLMVCSLRHHGSAAAPLTNIPFQHAELLLQQPSVRRE